MIAMTFMAIAAVRSLRFTPPSVLSVEEQQAMALPPEP
jgi:hypothetical protein